MSTKSNKATRPNVAIIYVRVSTGKQTDGLSLDQQTRLCLTAATAAGYEPLIMREEGRSAKNISGRPVLREALDILARGEAAALIVAKLDRLTRKTTDPFTLAEASKAQGWALLALDVGGDIHSPMGEFHMGIYALAAQLERRKTGERIEEWHQELRDRGTVWGRDIGPRSPLPAAVRLRISDEAAAGKSLRAIARDLEEDGIPTARGGKWNHNTVRKVLASPLNA